jgi:hypothetical protein
MQLDPAFKIEKACSSDQSRPVLSCAYLDAGEGKLVATDSYALAVVPVELEEGDTSGLVPAAAFQAWRKASTRTVPAGFSANGAVEVSGPDGSSSFVRPEGQFPRWAELVGTPRDGGTGEELQPIAEFGIDAGLLARLAEAIGAGKHGHVRVKVYSPLRPIRVESMSGEGFGIVMPVRVK